MRNVEGAGYQPDTDRNRSAARAKTLLTLPRAFGLPPAAYALCEPARPAALLVPMQVGAPRWEILRSAQDDATGASEQAVALRVR
jgi:hypothetical protein